MNLIIMSNGNERINGKIIGDPSRILRRVVQMVDKGVQIPLASVSEFIKLFTKNV